MTDTTPEIRLLPFHETNLLQDTNLIQLDTVYGYPEYNPQTADPVPCQVRVMEFNVTLNAEKTWVTYRNVVDGKVYIDNMKNFENNAWIVPQPAAKASWF